MKILLLACLLTLLPAACDKPPKHTVPFQDLSQHTLMSCPPPSDTLTILTGGQSNAGNYNSRPSKTRPGENVFVFYEGHCYAAQDPMPGAAGSRGSLWPHLGRIVAQATGKPVLFIETARGGSLFSDWLGPQSPYMRDLRRQIELAAGQGFSIDWMLWHQGETNTLERHSPQQNYRELKSLTAHLLSLAPHARLYLFRVSRCSGKELGGSSALRQTQTRVAASNPRIIAGFDTDILGDDYRWDRCHFNGFAREVINTAVAATLIAASNTR